MNKIEKLIEELCPDGVAFREFRTIAKFQGGHPFDSAKFNDLGIGLPVIRIGDVNSGPGGKFYDGDFPKEVLISDGDLLISMSGDFKILEWSYGPGLLNQRVCKLDFKTPDVLKRFVYHYLEEPLQRVHDATSMSVLKNLSNAVLGDLKVPVPPLEVQQEIVSILDKFTELEKELEKELEARKRQFNYFVDELTSAGTASRSGGLTCLFGDLGEFVRGSGLQKSDLSDEGAPALHYGQIFTYYKTKIYSAKSMVTPRLAASIRQAEYGDVIIATTSENIEDVCKSVVWLGEGNLAVGGETFIFKHELDPLYATYLFRSSDFQYQKLSHISGTKVKRVSGKSLEKMTVSVPDRETQVQIGSFLSQLEDLLGDVHEGLPAEIQARRKQYEYYRNKLLTFKELDAA